jgi:DNA-binding NarL/FixJ family response regulator
MSIRVLIAEDHGVVAGALRSLIEAEHDMTVVGCVEDGHAAARAAQNAKPDVVIMDFAMPGLNGAEATRLIHTRCPDTRVVILSMHASQEHVRIALRSGASGYVVKHGAPDELVAAIRTVHAGRRFLSAAVAEIALDDYAYAGDGDAVLTLSSRERQVLQLLAEGLTTAAIARHLSLSPKTVETYRARIMDKLDIHDLAGLIRFAIRHGITTLE